MFILGAGVGSVMQVLILAVQNSVDRSDMGTATGTSSFLRSMGGSFGVALFGAVLSNRLAHNLGNLLPGGSLPPGVSADTLRGSPAAILALPDEVRAAVVEAFSRSIDTVFLVAVPISLLGFVMTLFLREVPLRSSHEPIAEAREEAAVAGPAMPLALRED
jgi:hypothetical protein